MPGAEILPARPHPAPMPGPLLVDARGVALLPLDDGRFTKEPLQIGVRLQAWYETPEFGGAVIVVAGSGADAARLSTIVHRSGLSALIADLQSIEAQLEAQG